MTFLEHFNRQEYEEELAKAGVLSDRVALYKTNGQPYTVVGRTYSVLDHPMKVKTHMENAKMKNAIVRIFPSSENLYCYVMYFDEDMQPIKNLELDRVDGEELNIFRYKVAFKYPDLYPDTPNKEDIHPLGIILPNTTAEFVVHKAFNDTYKRLKKIHTKEFLEYVRNLGNQTY